MFLYYTRGLVRWVAAYICGDMGATKAEGQARLEPPRNPGYAYTGLLRAGSGIRGVRGGGQLRVRRWQKDSVGSRVMDVSTVAGVRETTEGPLLLRRMRAALFLGCRFAPDREALAFCLLRCCCVAVPCPLTPGEQTGQRPSPLLMLTLCSGHCPQSLVDRYPRSSGSSVMLWATSGSPGTHGMERGRNHLSARDAR